MGNIVANPQIHEYSLIRGLLVVSVLLMLPLCLWAQPGTQKVSKKAEKLYEESTTYMQFGDYEAAETKLLEALGEQPDYHMALERLGYVYIQMDQHNKAYPYIKKLVELAPTHSKEAYYYLGLTGLAAHQFDEAIAYLEHYKTVGSINDKRQQEIDRLEANLKFAREAIKNPIPFDPVSAGPDVNTPSNEYFPSITADGGYLYFTRQVQVGKYTHEDIFVSLHKDGLWQGSYSISDNVNNPNQNEGAHSISPDGKTLLFTICESSMGYGGCDIYMSRRQGNNWSKPMNLGPRINTKHKETQPCLAPDGRSLYFVSSRDGGYGMLDIWVSHIGDDGYWSEPVNLGPTVNTAGLDERPYIHTDNNTLYFSSDGHPGFGDADIYLSRRQTDDSWGTAQNLGYPLNSFDYEGGIYVTRDGEQAYFATDRYSEKGDLDIYHFDLPEQDKPTPATYVTGTVTDKDTGKPVEASIQFLQLETGEVENQVQAGNSGDFFLTLPTGKTYALNVSMPGYLFYSEHFSLMSIDPAKPFELQVQLQPVEVGEKLVLKNIFYEKEAFALKPESKVELNKLVAFLKENPTMKIEIGGHTDDSGTAAFNKDLSQKRANEVKQYLISQGIDAARLSTKGYGQDEPLLPNTTEENRAQNRRTEVKIIEK